MDAEQIPPSCQEETDAPPEFEGNLIAMINSDVEQIAAGTQQKHPRYSALRIRLSCVPQKMYPH
jgi:hypothetical protein